MERFENRNDDRIFISYELLTNDSEGPQEAIRLNNFLSKSDGVRPIQTESIPCVWRAVVKYKEQLKTQNTTLEDEKRRLDPAHHDSQRSGPTERPYTQDLLEAMSNMLINLIQTWGDRNLRLRTILEGYQQDIYTAYLNIIHESIQANTDTKTFHIFQVSLPHTGSTVLNNILTGLFDPTAAYKKSSMITITHEMNLLDMYKKEKPNFDEIFFVVTNKGVDSNPQFDKELCKYDNVLCIRNEELIYNSREELHRIVDSVANQFQSRFQYFFGLESLDESKRTAAVKRQEAMDIATAALNGQSREVPDTISGVNEKTTEFRVNGKSFHIFQASPRHTASTLVTNWLMGLFESDRNYSFLVNDATATNVRSNDKTVPIDAVRNLWK